MEQSPYYEVTVAQLNKKFPAFYGIWKLIIVFTRADLWTLSWASKCNP